MEENLCDVCPWYVDRGGGYCRKGIITLNEYSPERHPKYDNYDTINVDKVREIPYDYGELWACR